MNLAAKNVSLTLNDNPILNNMDILVRNQEFVGLLGPNGSGKSTFLKSIYRTMKPDVGWISLANQDIYKLPPRKVARQMAVVRQESAIEFDFSVREIVMMGRFPHKSAFQSDTKQDEELVNETLARVGMQDFAERSFTTLSGGEKQRVLIARALAQQAKLLVLDEPTNHLDIHSQLQIMAILKKLRCTVLTALHDLNIAAVYCDRLYIVKSGEIVASGTPAEVLQPQLINDVFGVDCEVSIHPRTAKPHIVFLSAIEKEIS
ncbi:ABC transporter [Pueribacillus theae]|uniref:ABC transporter n=1 Tax=Pueribacillus theae TaxID=2171751 RepID=A0A2U1K4K1_9BACI|nr:ABC transporter ATP-binding protein [Pueribacillus theae]PWA12195.1 ABC transporter [Pueribacillus theae]